MIAVQKPAVTPGLPGAQLHGLGIPVDSRPKCDF